MIYITDEDIEKASKNGIKYKTLYNRIYYYGWSKQRATTEPTEKGYKKWLQVALKNGIPEKTYNNRIYISRYSYEKAATKPLRSGGYKKRRVS